MKLRRAPRKPVVLFVDTGRWTCFDQMSAVLRGRGYRTVRISVERSRMSRVMSALDYDEHIVIDDVEDLRDLDRLLDCRAVVDVQCTEVTLTALAGGSGTSHLPSSVDDHLRWRLRYLDKLETSRTLARAGVPVPLALDAREVSPSEAVRQLGLPLVVKGRIGFGGAQVQIAHSPDDVERSLDSLGGGTEGGVFYEQLIPGPVVRYVAAYGDDGIYLEGTFVAHRCNPSSLGPATSVETVEHPELRRVGRQVVATLGGRGLVNIEAIQAADGAVFVIDVNLRAWGSVVALRHAGVDFVAGYVTSLGRAAPAAQGTTSMPTFVIRPARYANVFPDRAMQSVQGNGMAAPVSIFLRDGLPYLRWAGVRYWCAASALFGGKLVRQLL